MASRRLLLVHLYLPNTLDFQAWPDEQSISHYRVPSQARGDSTSSHLPITDAPPSPPPALHSRLSVDELDSKLQRASIDGNEHSILSSKQLDRSQDDDNDDAISDSEDGPSLGPIGRSSAPSGSNVGQFRQQRSERGSFSEQNKKVSMTTLMSEAASGGSNSIQAEKNMPIGGNLASRSRRGSANAPVKPSILGVSDDGEDASTRIPIAPASDHGRSATSQATLSSSPSQMQTLGASSSRRGSMSGTLNVPSLPSQSTSVSASKTPTRQPAEGAGTRTPGARAGGKAGTMTPLSIIGDLAAKQSAIPPKQLPTAGDTDRHHPFGSGAVTPMREVTAIGTGTRTPGRRPVISGSNGVPPSRTFASGLTLTKVNENNNNDRTGKSNTLGGAATPLRPSRPALSNVNRATEGSIPTAMDNWFINEHGRGADAIPPPPGKAIRPTMMSRGSSQARLFKESTGAHSPFIDQAASFQDHQRENTQPGSVQYHPSTGPTGPPAAPSTNWNRSNSKNRQTGRQSTVGRRPSSIGGRAGNRRSSVETFGEETMTEVETPVLPPYDFIPNPSSNGGLMNAVKSLTNEQLRGGKVFIGTPGVATNEWAGDAEKNNIAKRLKEECDSVPVWVEDDTFEAAYAHFCKQILWPTFHYTLPTRNGLEHEHEGFECYRELNKRFAQAIIDEYKEGDIIFINDYHLLLVPEMVREKLPHSKICFFLHIAWPSSEIFRCLTARTHILKGMLGADLVGFQTQNFARHFRQTVSRILQLEATPKGIQIDGRGGFVTVATFPIGIDVKSLNKRRAQPDVAEWVEKLRSRYEGKKVVVGRDKLDSIKGVRQKLLAFETALHEHPDLVGKVVLLQVALATTEENEEVAAATDVVSRINNKYSTLTYQPVVFLHVQDITFCQYLALLTIADAFLATSLREGMNLTSHEFVICQEVKHKPLILSEFTGTYSSLRACIGINPWNTKQVADAIYKAIMMDEDEALERWKDLRRQVMAQDAQHWIQSLLGRLERAHIDQQRRNNLFVPRLEIGQSEWRASKSRLILLDLEGTLMHDDPLLDYAKGFEVPEEVIKVLHNLTEDPKNRVYILSGKGTQDLTKIVERVPRVGLVAENGCAVMYAGSAPHEHPLHFGDHHHGQRGTTKSWTSLVAGINMSWREPVLEILRYFTERTPGSWLEDRGASILWRFWSERFDEKTAQDNKEFHWARRQAAEVQNLIYDSLGERFSLRIIPGKTSFLIMPKNTSRASAIQHVVSISHIGIQDTFKQAAMSPYALSPSASSSVREAQSRPHSTILKGSSLSKYYGGNHEDKNNNLEHIDDSDGTFDLESLPPPLPAAVSGLQPVKTALKQGIDLFRQPSNAWSMTGVLHEQQSPPTFHSRAKYNTHLLHPFGLGSFDLVVCIGQDDNLFAFINSLDLPFAPITCTSAGHSGDMQHGHNSHSVGVGSEANYYVNGPKDVYDGLHDILAFRGRDQKWGVPAMVDV